MARGYGHPSTSEPPHPGPLPEEREQTGSADQPEDHSLPPSIDRRYVVGACMIVMVLAAMELTVTSTAMPTIIGDLHGLEHYSWVTSVYLLVCTITMPIYGRLADAWGRKRVVLFAIALFCAASVLAASAQIRCCN